MQYDYGWIMNKSNNHTKQKRRGTETASFIKYFARQNGAEEYRNKQSKNLMKKGKYIYYILSIGRGNGAWAPYPFIEEIKQPMKFILTQDGVRNGEGTLWTFKIDMEWIETLPYNQRRKAGDYYSLSLTEVKTKAEGIAFDLNASNESEKNIGKILEKIMSDDEVQNG